MFLALRDIRFAKGRFALMTGVVALVTLLLVMLSCLTRGLGQQSTSAVQQLPATHVLLAPTGGTTSWGDSVIAGDQLRAARTVATDAEPLAVARARATASGTAADATTSIAVFGATPGGRALKALGGSASNLGDGDVVLPQEAADTLHATVGSTVELNGTALKVAAIQPTRWYSHSPVAWTTLATANTVGHLPAGQATALLTDSPRAAAAATAAHVTSLDGAGSLTALPGYSSEHGSLLMIQAFLYGITALVVIAFLSVWTIQRTRDVAVLRALGASRRYVLGDQLGQAAILLGLGTLAGGAVGTIVAFTVRAAVPVQVVVQSTLLPVAGVALVGLAGSVLATRRVTTVDPMIALGGN